MKRPAQTLLFALAGLASCLARAGARGNDPGVACAYGVPARYLEGVLSYPDFTVRLVSRSERFTADGRHPWVVYAFQVLDPESRTIGGDVVFNSEERANGRRFDVMGRIYVAEMYSTTRTSPKGAGSEPGRTRLPDDVIVIWDQASARQSNQPLLRIWETEAVQAGERYFPQNAYRDGVILPGFNPPPGRLEEGLSRIEGEPPLVRQVVVVGKDALRGDADATICEFGARVNFAHRVLRYGGFSVVLSEREEVNPFDPIGSYARYEFRVYEPGGVPAGGFQFETSGLANGCSFEVQGRTYCAEMFSTTAQLGGEAGEQGRALVPLRPGELIIWDEATARMANQRILPAWQARAEDAPWRSVRFAAGIRLTSRFTGTYMIGNSDSWCEYAKLDAPPLVVSRTRLVYPSSLSGSGFVGRVHGFLIVRSDGSVERAQTTDGNEQMFREPSQASLSRWRFSSPLKDSRPVRALLHFDWEISEPATDTQIRFH